MRNVLTKNQFSGLRYTLCAIAVALALLLTPQLVSQAKRLPTQELRGVWLTNIDSDLLFSRNRLKEGLKQLAQHHFNTVYPTVWNWGYTLYPSPVAAQATGLSQQLHPDLEETGHIDPHVSERDMLQELIAVANVQKLKVIPWFEFGFMTPAPSALAKRHPDWITQRRDGTSIVMEGTHPRVWLNPLHPEVQNFLVSLVDEVVTRYSVSGIQFDDHFGLPVDLGYDDFTVRLYQQEHQGKRPPLNVNDRAWKRWRADKITEVMAKVFQTVKAKNPQVILSLSPNPAKFAYDTILQDWVTWERRGYIEELVIQVYRSNRTQFLMELSRPEVVRAKRHIPVSIGILSGLKNRDVSMSWLDRQVKWVRDLKFSGVSFFFYESLWTSKTEPLDTRLKGFLRIFPTAVRRPSASRTS
jgi:uncharacterized lipoprotein YddW (UPF0748 family)